MDSISVIIVLYHMWNKVAGSNGCSLSLCFKGTIMVEISRKEWWIEVHIEGIHNSDEIILYDNSRNHL